MDARFREEVDHPKANGRVPELKQVMSRKLRFAAVRVDAIELPPKADDLVQDILTRGVLAVIYGESGCGKSFFASHMGMHIAAARSWGGKPTASGAVVYVTAEGARGFMKRMVAFRQQMKLPSGVQFYVITDAPDLGHTDGDAEELILRIRQQVGEAIALVIIDTMARVMQGADENSAKDVSVLVDNGGKIIEALQTSVALVHHIGKDGSRGARGSSVLRAAADTEILVEKTEAGRSATVTKQKDGQEGLTLSFDLEPVEIDGSGGETSCIVTVDTWQSNEGTKRAKVSGPALIALRALEEAIAASGEIPPASTLLSRTKRAVRMPIWRDACAKVQITEADTAEAKRKAFARAAQKLQDAGIVGVFDDWTWINR